MFCEQNMEEFMDSTDSIGEPIFLHVLGDSNVGKTALIKATKVEDWSNSNRRSLPEKKCRISFDRDNRAFDLQINIWNCEEAYDRYRGMISYHEQSHMYIVCFDFANQQSFINSFDKWIAEIRHWHHDAICPSMLLVGIRNQKRKVIETETAEEKAREHNVAYMECSLLTGEGIQELYSKCLTQIFPVEELDRLLDSSESFASSSFSYVPGSGRPASVSSIGSNTRVRTPPPLQPIFVNKMSTFAANFVDFGNLFFPGVGLLMGACSSALSLSSSRMQTNDDYRSKKRY